MQGAAALPTRALAALPRDQVRSPPAHLPRCRRRFHRIRFTSMGATRSRITEMGTTKSPCSLVREMVGSRGPLSVVHARGGGARWNKPEHVRTLLALVDAWALLEVSACTPSPQRPENCCGCLLREARRVLRREARRVLRRAARRVLRREARVCLGRRRTRAAGRQLRRGANPRPRPPQP